MLDGKTFKAEFVGVSGSSLELQNDAGVKKRFPIKKFSIVDRYFLHDKKDVPLEQLEGGDIYNAEMEIEFKFSDIKKVENFHFMSEGKKVIHRTQISPHFIFFYEDSVEVEPFIYNLERIWYAHALRTPGFLDDWGRERRAYFYVPFGEKLDKMRDYAIAGFGDDVDQYTKDSTWRNWYKEHVDMPMQVRAEFREKYTTLKTGKIESYNFSEREEKRQLLESYPFFEWQRMFFPGAKLPQRKVKTESKLASQKGYLCLIYANELRLNGNQNLTYSQFHENGLGIAVPKQGEVKDWAKELADLVEDGKVEPNVADMIYDDNETLTSVDGEKKEQWAQLLMSFGRFLEKDVAHMIYRCEVIDYIRVNDAFPSHEKLCEILRYEDKHALDTAFRTYIVQENMKVKK